MRGIRRQLTLALIAIAAYGIVIGAGQQRPAGGPYTVSQATAGRTVYQANCATCHGADLRGQASAPPIAGPGFLGTWGRVERPVNYSCFSNPRCLPAPSGA